MLRYHVPYMKYLPEMELWDIPFSGNPDSDSGFRAHAWQPKAKAEPTIPLVSTIDADQGNRGLWGRECADHFHGAIQFSLRKLGKTETFISKEEQCEILGTRLPLSRKA